MGISKVRMKSGGTVYEVRVTVGAQRIKRRCATMEQARQELAALQREAKDAASKRRLDHHARRLGMPVHEEITVGALIAKMLDLPEFAMRSKASQGRDQMAWWCLGHFFGEDFPVQQITAESLEALRRDMLRPYRPRGAKKKAKPAPRPRKGKKGAEREERTITRGPATVNRLMDAVSALLTRAVEWRHIGENPARWLEDLPTDPPPERIISRKEEEALLKAARAYGEDAPGKRPADREDLEEWIIFLVDSGARPFSEVGEITWGSLDWERGRIALPTAKRNRRRARTAAQDRRVITLPSRCLATLRKRRARLHPENVQSMDGGDPFRDEPIFGEDRQRGKRFQKVAKKAKLAGVTPYTLRHTCASRAVQGGASLTEVQYHLGHQDPRMTMRYAHFAPAMSDAVVRALEKIPDKGSEAQKVSG